ncbi:hypothetical protein [Saccharicrinis sp. GN24d3]|uniref:hypothetical protein n=1 Tax=Saccharicrinis sp. GN24d3 TaxID=3458416 RepID=UPI0040373391
MKNKALYYFYPLMVLVPLAFLMLRPGSFNLIPNTIYHSFEVSSMPEYQFIMWFDIVFLLIMYGLTLRVVNRIISWRKYNKRNPK